MRRLLVALAVVFSASCAHAATPTFQAATAVAHDTDGSVTVTLPAHQAGDILLFMCMSPSVTDTMSAPSGWTAVTGYPIHSTGTGLMTGFLFWLRATSSSETNPTGVSDETVANLFCMVATYRGVIQSGSPFDATGAASMSDPIGFPDPIGISEVTSTTAKCLIVAVLAGHGDPTPGMTVTSTDPATYTEHVETSTGGDDAVFLFSEGAQSAAGSSGGVTVDFDTTFPDDWVGMALALKPQGEQGWWGKKTRW